MYLPKYLNKLERQNTLSKYKATFFEYGKNALTNICVYSCSKLAFIESKQIREIDELTETSVLGLNSLSSISKRFSHLPFGFKI